MTVLLVAALCLACGALGAAAAFFSTRRRSKHLALALEARLHRLEKSAGRDALERLRIMRQRTGMVYLDGLPFAADKEVTRLFDAGLRHASRGHWEKASESWVQACKAATESEKLALDFLAGCCLMMGSRAEKAGEAFRSVLARAEGSGDRPAAASCYFVLGRLDEESKRYANSRDDYLKSAGLWRTLDDVESETASLRQAAVSSARLGQWKEALDLHRQALRLLERLDDKVGAAAEYGAVGTILGQQGEFDKARAAHEDGLHFARQAGDRLGEADRLSAIGEIHLRQGSPKRALDVFERALRSYQDAHRHSGEAWTLCRIALAHVELGERDVALEHYEQALRLGRRLGDRRIIACGLEGVAEGAASHGDPERAQSLLEAAVGLDRETGNEAGIMRRLSALGRVLLLRHDNEKAEAVLHEAVETCRRLKDSGLELSAAVDLARARREQGRVKEALDVLEHYRGSLPAEPADAASWHMEAGLCYLGLDDRDKAVVELRQAVELRRARGGRELGQALVNLGVALNASGDREAGLRIAEDGLRELHNSGTHSDEVWALWSLAGLNRSRGNPAAARQNLERALELARQGKEETVEAECLLLLGRSAAADGDFGQARELLERAARFFTTTGSADRARQATEEIRRLPRSGAGVRFLDEDRAD